MSFWKAGIGGMIGVTLGVPIGETYIVKMTINLFERGALFLGIDLCIFTEIIYETIFNF